VSILFARHAEQEKAKSKKMSKEESEEIWKTWQEVQSCYILQIILYGRLLTYQTQWVFGISWITGASSNHRRVGYTWRNDYLVSKWQKKWLQLTS